MRYLLIPVKDLARAKQRLSGLMTQEERTRLAWAMLETTFAAASAVKSVDRIAVVTLYPPALALAGKSGMEIIIETEQSSESASVDFGSKELIKRGATAVLRLPLDLPLIESEDLEIILSYRNAGVVLVPSRDGTGTNAILRSPPDLFPSHFGPGSLAKHLEAAAKAQAECEVIQLPRIALDLDDQDDLVEFLDRGAGTPVWELLQEMRIVERLAKLK